MRCLDEGRVRLKHKRECGYRTALDMLTLVATRGRDFPMARLAERLRCPRCGCRQVAVMFGKTKHDNASWQPHCHRNYRVSFQGCSPALSP
jgi:hypothetical protein